MTGQPSDAAPTVVEAVAQVAAGLRVFGIGHPGKLSHMLAYALPRHGLTPAAAIIGAGVVWGDAVALTDRWGDVTYAELASATGRVAAGLIPELGTRARVGIMIGDDRYFLVALGAACLNGARMVMLNPRLGSDDLSSVIDQQHLDVIIASPGANLVGFGGRVIFTDSFTAMDAVGGVPNLARRSRMVMLTGGTTRAPSPIKLKRRASAALPMLALAGVTDVRNGLPTLICAPLFHGYGLACAMLCLIAGSPMVLSSACRDASPAGLDKGKVAPGWGEAIALAIRQYQVHTVFAVPAQLRSLALFLNGHPSRDDKECVAAIVSGADRLDASTIEAIERRWGPVVVNYYGTTESGTATMIAGAALAQHPESLGRPVAGCRIRIVGASGNLVPRGTVGRVQVCSPMTSVGPGTSFTTNDLGWMDDDGFLYMSGRAGRKLRLGGEFVDLASVEAVVGQIDGVDAARAFVVDDQVMGQRVAIEVASSIELDAEAVRAVVRERLGPASVPVAVTTVQS